MLKDFYLIFDVFIYIIIKMDSVKSVKLLIFSFDIIQYIILSQLRRYKFLLEISMFSKYTC